MSQIQPASDRTVTTKPQALAFRYEKIKYGYHRSIREKTYFFLLDIGAKKDIPENAKQYVMRVLDSLTVNNPYYPDEVPFDIVLPRFYAQVVSGQVERKGNNISAIIGAFRSWISRPGVEQSLIQQWRYEQPGSVPKELSQGNLPERIEDWPRDEVKGALDAYLKLKQTSPDELEILDKEAPGADNYFQRLLRTAQSHGLI